MMTEAFCKIEYRCSLALHLACMICAFTTIYVLPHFSPNAFSLPLNCHVIFLPVDEFSINWELNYFIMAFALTLLAILFTCYVHVPFLLMNQSCWLLEMASLTAEQLNNDLQLEDESKSSETLVENFRLLVQRCEKFVEWQEDAQELLQWNFNLEFQVQSMILCLSIYVLSFTLSGTLIILAMAVACCSQLFAYCWMGTRIKSRIEKLSHEIGKNWYLMPPKQRKTAQMIVHWTQNMEGFSGTFSNVGVETFQKVNFWKKTFIFYRKMSFLFNTDYGSFLRVLCLFAHNQALNWIASLENLYLFI